MKAAQSFMTGLPKAFHSFHGSFSPLSLFTLKFCTRRAHCQQPRKPSTLKFAANCFIRKELLKGDLALFSQVAIFTFILWWATSWSLQLQMWANGFEKHCSIILSGKDLFSPHLTHSIMDAICRFPVRYPAKPFTSIDSSLPYIIMTGKLCMSSIWLFFSSLVLIASELEFFGFNLKPSMW